MKTDAELFAELGLDGYVEAYADALDTLFPLCGDVLRRCWQDIRLEILSEPHRAIAGICDAANEFEYYR